MVPDHPTPSAASYTNSIVSNVVRQIVLRAEVSDRASLKKLTKFFVEKLDGLAQTTRFFMEHGTSNCAEDQKDAMMKLKDDHIFGLEGEIEYMEYRHEVALEELECDAENERKSRNLEKAAHSQQKAKWDAEKEGYGQMADNFLDDMKEQADQVYGEGEGQFENGKRF
ncbi:hypothetical protein B9Z55_025972 [Caenorhabditis nigoni]|uniref:Biogenesis of lysosome-related organelles complex 1 subunit 5 n=1 Tax=Caenorhabditis nigoni TaxID=1611254 RepID=A0A2G5T1J1_9PELO|nr:hypothetical protein B9Z55_025972 [Caenorhabditis nigoni]